MHVHSLARTLLAPKSISQSMHTWTALLDLDGSSLQATLRVSDIDRWQCDYDHRSRWIELTARCDAMSRFRAGRCSWPILDQQA